MILIYRSVVIHEDDGHGRLESSVLECVIEDDKVCRREILVYAFSSLLRCLECFRMDKELTAFYSGTVHGYSDFRKLLLYLKRLVSICECASIRCHLLEAFCLALVSA